MHKPFTIALIFSCACFVSISGNAQQFPGAASRWIDSVKVFFSDSAYRIAEQRLKYFGADSAIQLKLKGFYKPQLPGYALVKALIDKPELRIAKPLISFGGGSVSYNGIYRSSIDTPFKESGIFQHLLSGRLNFTVKRCIPLTLTYFERQSNSIYFKDYRDFRVEFNPQEFERLQEAELQKYVSSSIEKMRDPLTRPMLDFTNDRLLSLQQLFDQSWFTNKFIGSRISVASNGYSDTSGRDRDSVIKEAKEFIAYYDSLKLQKKLLEKFKDSLQDEYVRVEKKILKIKRLLNARLSPGNKSDSLKAYFEEKELSNSRVQKLSQKLMSIRKLAVGKVSPGYSDLTLKNVNVNGIDFEYNRKFYFALSAGVIDFRARDFLYTGPKRKPQFIYASRFGYGKKESTHIFLTGFKGKKQLLSSSTNSKTFDVYGLSFETQVLFAKNFRFTGEIAQSVSPGLVSLSGGSEKPSFNIKDKNNKAYSLKINSFFPRAGSKVEVFYQYRGINYQSFTSYYSNAVLNSWYIKAGQYLFKRRLNINASLVKNSFENPNLLIRYNGNSVFKNVAVLFRKQRWPTFSIGYLPSSQLSEIGGQIYQNYFQTFNFNLSHNYKLGEARGFSLLSYNQFYNDSQDSGFVYFNSRNIFFSQSIQFHSYAANINIAKSSNSDYTLTTFDAGVNANVFRNSLIGLGVKISQLNGQELKVGLYGRERFVINKFGEINVSIEKSYLPGFHSNLVKSDLYTIGYTRYFK